MGWLSFLAIYLLGGLTLIPILLLCASAYLFILWLQAPPATFSIEETEVPNDYVDHDSGTLDSPNAQSFRSGWIRVSREYLPKPNLEGGYLSGLMMQGIQSFMDKNKPAAPKRPKDAFFAVLKFNTLFLYDSEMQMDCKGVIVLSLHKVSLYPEHLPDNEVFLRPNSIRLTREEQDEDMLDPRISNDYYIFCDRPIEKEDWYFALLRASTMSQEDSVGVEGLGGRARFDQAAIQELIQTVHSDEHHFHTQWLNAILGRIFLGIYKTEAVRDYFVKKIVKKSTKIKRPSFLGKFQVREVHVGDSLPFITHPRLLEIQPTGDLTAEFNMVYGGGFRVVFQTVATFSYSSRMKPIQMTLVLAVVIRQLSGKMQLRIKAPPTNRFWLGFYDMPELDLEIEPVVSAKQVRSTTIISVIEARIRDMIQEAMVLPNMDDFPFFPTGGLGGIFDEAVPAESGIPISTESSAASSSRVDTANNTTEEKGDKPGQKARGGKVKLGKEERNKEEDVDKDATEQASTSERQLAHGELRRRKNKKTPRAAQKEEHERLSQSTPASISSAGHKSSPSAPTSRHSSIIMPKSASTTHISADTVSSTPNTRPNSSIATSVASKALEAADAVSPAKSALHEHSSDSLEVNRQQGHEKNNEIPRSGSEPALSSLTQHQQHSDDAATAPPQLVSVDEADANEEDDSSLTPSTMTDSSLFSASAKPPGTPGRPMGRGRPIEFPKDSKRWSGGSFQQQREKSRPMMDMAVRILAGRNKNGEERDSRLTTAASAVVSASRYIKQSWRRSAGSSSSHSWGSSTETARNLFTSSSQGVSGARIPNGQSSADQSQSQWGEWTSADDKGLEEREGDWAETEAGEREKNKGKGRSSEFSTGASSTPAKPPRHQYSKSATISSPPLSLDTTSAAINSQPDSLPLNLSPPSPPPRAELRGSPPMLPSRPVPALRRSRQHSLSTPAEFSRIRHHPSTGGLNSGGGKGTTLPSLATEEEVLEEVEAERREIEEQTQQQQQKEEEEKRKYLEHMNAISVGTVLST
ncbi:uncharacterized protein VTP21DRAFT_9200 [Calcarisporiella thermophila]|uniref:uncharacterized protein n=1 Tax=Calcarisporiella thermophila TaxID=911321 RepID=UPI0037432092